MSHHGNPTEPSKELREAMGKMFGEYPAGKLNDNDAGAIAFEVGRENDKVILRFTKPVAWMGMTGDEAMQLAQCLIKHARHAGISAPMILRIGE